MDVLSPTMATAQRLVRRATRAAALVGDLEEGLAREAALKLVLIEARRDVELLLLEVVG